jgi:hypothetical protein
VLLQGFNDDYYKNTLKFEPITDYLRKPIKNLKALAEAQPVYAYLLNQLLNIVDDNSLSQLELLTRAGDYLGTLVDDFPFLMEDLKNINRGIQNLQQVGAVGEQGSLPESSLEPSIETGSTVSTEQQPEQQLVVRDDLKAELVMAFNSFDDVNILRNRELVAIKNKPEYKALALDPLINMKIGNEKMVRDYVLKRYIDEYEGGFTGEVETDENDITRIIGEIGQDNTLMDAFNNSLSSDFNRSLQSVVVDEYNRITDTLQRDPEMTPRKMIEPAEEEEYPFKPKPFDINPEETPEIDPTKPAGTRADREIQKSASKMLNIIHTSRRPERLYDEILAEYNKISAKYPIDEKMIPYQEAFRADLEIAGIIDSAIDTVIRVLTLFDERLKEANPQHKIRTPKQQMNQEGFEGSVVLTLESKVNELQDEYAKSISREVGLSPNNIFKRIFKRYKSRLLTEGFEEYMEGVREDFPTVPPKPEDIAQAPEKTLDEAMGFASPVSPEPSVGTIETGPSGVPVGTGIIPARLHKKALKKLELEDKRKKKLAPKKKAAAKRKAAKKQKAIDKTQPVVDAIKQLEKEIKDLREGKKGTGAYSNANAFSFTQDKKTLAQARKQVKSGATGRSGRGIAKIPDGNKLKKEMEILMASHKAGNKGGRLTAQASKKFNELLASGYLSKEEERRMKNFLKRA